MAKGRSESEFTEGTKRILARRVGERCSRPTCPHVTSAPHSDSTKAVNMGKASHIIAASENGPRGDPSMTPQERKHPDNGIWLCAICGDIIDKDFVKYPASLLQQWKADAEAQQERRLLSHHDELEDYWLCEIEWCESLIKDLLPDSCLAYLDRIQPRFWDKASPELKAKTLHLRARAWFRLHDFETSADFFAQAGNLLPDTLQGKCNIAHSHLLLHRPELAESNARDALAIDSSNSRARALTIAAQGDQQTYHEIVDTLPVEWESDSDVCFALGVCAERGGHLTSAAECFAKCQSLSSDPPVEALARYAAALHRLVENRSPLFPGKLLSESDRTQLEHAVSLLDKAWQLLRDTEIAHLHLDSLSNAVFLHFILGDYPTGMALVDEGLLVNPDEERLINFKVMLLNESDNVPLREAFLRDAVRRNERPFTLRMLALHLLNNGDNDELKDVLERLFSFELSPDEHETALALKLLYYINTGDPESAASVLDTLPDDERSKPIFQIYHARVLLASGQEPDAKRLLRSLSSQATEWEPAQQLEFADTCHRAGLFTDAISFYKRNVSQDKDSTTLRKLMECYVRVGDRNSAFTLARDLRERLGPLFLVTKYEASAYESIGDLPNCTHVLKLYIATFPSDTEAKLWLIDVLLRQGLTTEADALLSTEMEWHSLSAEHICYYAQLLTRRERVLDALQLLYEARRLSHLRYTSSQIHLGYMITFMRAEQEKDFTISEIQPGTSVQFSSTDNKCWHTILLDSESVIGNCELHPDAPLATRLLGHKVGDTVVLRQSPVSTEEVRIEAIQSNYVRAFQEVFEHYEAWFGCDAGLWSIKLPMLEDGTCSFDPVLRSAIERESHVRQVLNCYQQGLLPQSLFAQLLGGHFMSAWAFLSSSPKSGIRFSPDCTADVIAANALFQGDRPRLVVDLSSLLTIRCLHLDTCLKETFGPPLIAQATMDEITTARSKEELLGSKEHLTVSSDSGNMVGHRVSKEVAEHNISELQAFEGWVREFCEIMPIPRILTDLKEPAEHLESAVGPMEAHTIILAACPENLLYSDDFPVRALAGGMMQQSSVSTVTILAHLAASGVIDKPTYESHLLHLFELNYRELPVSVDLIMSSINQSEWSATGSFASICAALRHCNYAHSSLIGVVTQCLIAISDSQASESRQVHISCHLLSSICSPSNAASTVEAVISAINHRSCLYLPSDKRIIDMIKLWYASCYPA